DARAMGETGRELAMGARLRLLISLGLLKDAAEGLASPAGQQTGGTAQSPRQNDYASMLAIGQAWVEVRRPEEARRILAGIPSYAGEYGAAQVSLASLDLEEGRADAAVKSLEKLQAVAPSA